MQLTGRSRVVGLFGDPVGHSLSPLMQNAALQAAAIDAVYVPFHVTATDLAAAIDGVRRLGLVGVNLTIPHKEAALPFVDELAEGVSAVGSINTIVNDGGRLVGHNTDGSGLLLALHREFGLEVAGRRVMLLGAGGACRAVAAAMARAGAAWIGVANRTGERAAGLVAQLHPLAQGTTFAALPLDADLATALPGPVDLLVNTSSVGLGGESWDVPVLDCVRPGGAVYDAVYGRQPTPLVRAARLAGMRSADGLAMLAAQGELAFRLWFGQEPPAGTMMAALKEVCPD